MKFLACFPRPRIHRATGTCLAITLAWACAAPQDAQLAKPASNSRQATGARQQARNIDPSPGKATPERPLAHYYLVDLPTAEDRLAHVSLYGDSLVAMTRIHEGLFLAESRRQLGQSLPTHAYYDGGRDYLPYASKDDPHGEPTTDRARESLHGSCVHNDPIDTWADDGANICALWLETPAAGTTGIAFLDSGISPHHADLAAAGIYITPFNALRWTGSTDNHGHGTAVASVAIACGDNGAGAAGVCSTGRILTAKVWDPSENGNVKLHPILQAIYHVANNTEDIGIINVSLTLWFATPPALLSRAIDYAADNGIIIVCAAGNQSSNLDIHQDRWPACFGTRQNVITVAALSRTGELCGFSNFGGTTVSIAAPGERIRSALHTDASSDGVCRSTGTSFAAAFVSGVLAASWNELGGAGLLHIPPGPDRAKAVGALKQAFLESHSRESASLRGKVLDQRMLYVRHALPPTRGDSSPTSLIQPSRCVQHPPLSLPVSY